MAEFNVRGSKSIITKLICMSLYHNIDFTITNMNFCNDVMEMLEFLETVGKHYVIKEDKLEISKAKPFTLVMSNYHLIIKNIGNILGFVLPFLAFADYKFVDITLDNTISELSIQPLVECLNKAGANIILEKNTIHIKKHTHVNNIFNVDIAESCKYLPSLMMFATTRIGVTRIVVNNLNKIVSQSYVKMTEDILKLFSIQIRVAANEVYVVTSNKNKVENVFLACDPDYSTAASFWFYSYLMRKPVFIKTITYIHQPDFYFYDIIKRFNVPCSIKNGIMSIEVENIRKPPEFISVDMKTMPEQIITLAFMALFSGKKVVITGCKTLTRKESNRISGILVNIDILGGQAKFANDELTIFPFEKEPESCLLNTFYDHRFAMTFLVLQQKYKNLQIDNIDCINKVYPDFNIF